MKTLFFFASIFFSVSVFPQALPFKIISERPKLVLVVVVDQLRADYLPRMQKYLLPAQSSQGVGGFRYLMEKGAYFPQGQFDILQNMTAPGHSTILTGAYPYQSGIPLNYWYDTRKQEPVYALQDEAHQWIGSFTKKKTRGTSPKNLLASTVGDELKNAGYPSQIVSLALKDRAAILLGGHRPDEALWFDPKEFQWTSSTYYHPTAKLPKWVGELNSEIAKAKGTTKKWERKTKTDLVHSDNALLNLDDETTVGFGVNFPHTLKIGEEAVLGSPYGIQITVTAAEKAIDTFKLGKNNATDLLAVGFSSFDYLGHDFGPNSVEMDELTVELDRSLAKLFRTVDKKVAGGLKNTVIVLTADHGIPPLPEWLEKDRVAAARLDEATVKEKIEAKLVEKLGQPDGGKWILEVREMNFFLNPKAYGGKKSEKTKVENEIKNILVQWQEIAHAFSSSDYENRVFPVGAWERQVKHTYFPGRSGEVIGLLNPYYMAGEDKVMHMTPYKYDSSVPILLAGKHILPGVHSGGEVVDIAATLSLLVGTVAPSMCEGRVLSEILR